MRLQRLSASVGLLVYVTGALVYPELHRRHHARFGADHVHGALGTILLHAAAPPSDELTVFDHHAAFDLDLASLELADVAHAGALTVDCALAEYTGVECTAARPDHAHNFGDELFAHHHHQHSKPNDVDPDHGAGSLEHLGASLLATRSYVLPPPAASATGVVVEARPVAPSLPSRRTQLSRAPPPLA